MTTTIAPDIAKAAQLAAIEASGSGRPFQVVQPRNACFWVFLWGMAAGLIQLIQFFGPGLGAYNVGLGSGTLMFALYTVPWLLLLAYHNRYTPLPSKLLLVAFGWGAVAATFWMSLQANTAILSLYTKLIGAGWTRNWGAGLTAPFTEEASKATALVLLIGLAPRLVRSAYDGLIIGAFAGLGFQILEDLLYVFNGVASGFGADQIGAAFRVFVTRSMAGLVQHVLFSAIFCAGLMWLIGRAERGHRVRGALLMVAAMVVHSVWDNLNAIGFSIAGVYGLGLVTIVLVAAELVLLWWTFHLAAPQEQAWMRAVLDPEVERGVITSSEASAATGGIRARRAHRESLHGHRNKKAGRHLIAAAQDLATELAKAGGRETERVAHARTEITRLRLDA